MSELQQREAALKMLLAEADFVHWTPLELAEDVPTERGLVGEPIWRQALQLVGRYEPLRPLFARRNPQSRGNGRPALAAANIDLWRLRWDLEHLVLGADLLVGDVRVKRVVSKYGARWWVSTLDKSCDLFEALLALKEHYMQDTGMASRVKRQINIDIGLLRDGALSVDALAIYLHLIAFAKDSLRDGEPPTTRELAKAAGISDRRVVAAIKELETKGVIVVEARQGKPSLYAFPDWSSTPPQICMGSSYISLSDDSNHQDGDKESATPRKSAGGGKKSDHSPEETQAIAALLKAWKDASGTAGSPFANKTYRMQALELHHFGVNDDDVTRYVKSLQSEPFWKRTGVSWAQVCKGVRAWAGKLDKPAAVQLPVDPFAGQAPQRIG